MPDPQDTQAPQIDLSAGMVPKQAAPSIDLSAGMVPKSQFGPDPNAAAPHMPTLEEEGPGSVAKGFGKGALETTAGIGSLIQKIPVVGEKIIPEAGLEQEKQAAQTQGLGEGLGSFAENVAEFATGDELLEGLTKYSKLEKLMQKSPQIAKFVADNPNVLHRIVKGAVKEGTVGAAQGAVKGAAEGDAVAGAKAGAIGGAIGGAAAEGGEAVLKPAAKSVGLATSDAEDIMRAAKPGKRNYQFLNDWNIAKDRIANEVEEGGKFKDFGEAADRIRDVRQNLWQKEVMPIVAKHADEQMFKNAAVAAPPGSIPATNPVSSAIRAKITPTMEKLSKQSATAIEKYAQKFDTPLTVGQAEADLEHLNAELSTKGFWKMSPSERAAAAKADPFIASRSAASDALRSSIYDHLDVAGESNIKDLKKQYGAISNVEREIRGQANVTGRQVPLSLKQMIAIASGHPLSMGAALIDKLYNDPAAILNRAVSKVTPAGPVKAAAKDIVAGAGAVAKKAVPAAGANMIRWTASDGSVHQANATPDQVIKIDPDAKFDAGEQK